MTAGVRASLMYSARRRRQPSGRYTLTGLAVCGLCDSGLAGRPITGTALRMYLCKACHRISVDVARLDVWAADWAIRELSDPENAQSVERAQRERNERRAELESELASIEADALAVADRFGAEVTRYDAITGRLDKRVVIRAGLECGHGPETHSPNLSAREAEAHFRFWCCGMRVADERRGL
jgi:hypothetical protein